MKIYILSKIFVFYSADLKAYATLAEAQIEQRKFLETVRTPSKWRVEIFEATPVEHSCIEGAEYIAWFKNKDS